ncbi:Tll0287-like domain-containing protein [Alteromonas macleodii]|uniref:Tll0287-like domain-containing protein n=1 Tax=Alteromonas macleodii TaxID=28108 RepID=UPI002FE3C338
MKNGVMLVAISLLASSAHSLADTATANEKQSENSAQEKVKEARLHAKALGGALKSRLQQAIQSGGLEAGVNECQIAATPIAQALSQKGWEVGRTALKVRNPNNAADQWEREQLVWFSQLLTKAKQDNLTPKKPLETYQYDSESGKFRYMMAIEQGQVCMACHGANVAPSVKQSILKHYPNDQATGFDLGELRGAFTLSYTP